MWITPGPGAERLYPVSRTPINCPSECLCVSVSHTLALCSGPPSYFIHFTCNTLGLCSTQPTYFIHFTLIIT